MKLDGILLSQPLAGSPRCPKFFRFFQAWLVVATPWACDLLPIRCHANYPWHVGSQGPKGWTRTAMPGVLVTGFGAPVMALWLCLSCVHTCVALLASCGLGLDFSTLPTKFLPTLWTCCSASQSVPSIFLFLSTCNVRIVNLLQFLLGIHVGRCILPAKRGF